MVRPEHAEARHRAGDDHPRREAPGHRDPREPLRPRESAPEELSRIRHQSGSRPSAVAAGLRTLRSRSDRRSREPITPVRRPYGSEHQRPSGAGMRSRAAHARGADRLLAAEPRARTPRRAAPGDHDHRAPRRAPRQADPNVSAWHSHAPVPMRTPTAAALTLRLAIRDQTSDARGALLRRGHARRMPMQAIIIRALIGEVRVRSASRAPQARAACRRGRAGRAAHTRVEAQVETRSGARVRLVRGDGRSPGALRVGAVARVQSPALPCAGPLPPPARPGAP